MPIPDFQTIMRPLLAAQADGKEHINRDLVSELADQFQLTEDERHLDRLLKTAFPHRKATKDYLKEKGKEP